MAGMRPRSRARQRGAVRAKILDAGAGGEPLPDLHLTCTHPDTPKLAKAQRGDPGEQNLLSVPTFGNHISRGGVVEPFPSLHARTGGSKIIPGGLKKAVGA